MKTSTTLCLLGVLAAMLAGGTARGQIAWIGGSDSNWSNSANWGGTVPGGGDVGLFQAGAAYPNQPNLTAPSPIGGLWNTGSALLSISGSALTINGATINGNLSTGIETDAGAGSMTISAPLVLGPGQTWLNNSGSLLTVSGNVDNGGGVLTVAGNSNVTISGVVSDNGGLTMNGAGTLLLSNNNSYTGDTNVNGGTLDLEGQYGTLAGNLKINSGTVYTGQYDGVFNQGSLNTVTIGAGGLLTVYPNGTIPTQRLATCDLGPVALTGGTLGGAGDPTWGSWWLHGTVSATGGVDSTMSAAGMTLPATQTFFVDSGSTLTVTGNFIATPNNNAGAIDKTGPGLLDLEGQYGTLAGPLIVDAGTVYVGPHEGIFGGSSNVQPITINAGGLLTLGSLPNSIGTVALSGGTLDGAGDRTYGSWWINGSVSATGSAVSTMNAAGMSLPQAQNFFVDSGSTLNITGNFMATPYSNTGSITTTGPGVLNLMSYATLCGNLNINNGIVFVGHQDGLFNPATLNTVTIGAGGLLTLGTAPVDLGPLVLTGGTLAGTGDPAYGSWWLNSGISATGSAVSTMSAVGMTFVAPTQTFFVDSGSTLNVTGTFIPTPANHTGGLTLTGSGMMILANNNTYTGDTNVNGGTLNLEVLYGSLAGKLNINSGGTVYVGQYDGLYNQENLQTVTIGAGGLLTVYPNSSTIGTGKPATCDLGPLVLTGGTLDGAGDPVWGSWWLDGLVTATGSAVSTLNSSAMTLPVTQTFFVDSGSSLNVTGNIIPTMGAENTGGLIKTGPGMMVLSGSNTYTGGTTVYDGTLVVQSPDSLLDGSNVSVGDPTLLSQFGQVVPMGQPASAVPEPGTSALLAAAGLLLLYRWRR